MYSSSMQRELALRSTLRLLWTGSGGGGASCSAYYGMSALLGGGRGGGRVTRHGGRGREGEVEYYGLAKACFCLFFPHFL